MFSSLFILIRLLALVKNHWYFVYPGLISAGVAYVGTTQNYDLLLMDFRYPDLCRQYLTIIGFLVVGLRFLARSYLKFNNNSPALFARLIIVILLFLVLSFNSSNLIIFYIRFEATLIPIFIIVIGWGYQPERVKASYYLLFYTLFASLPLLGGLLYLYSKVGTLNYSLLSYYFDRPSGVLFAVIIIAFLVKLPAYFTHLWLPKAHVEAPIAGSIILAGILLKLGGCELTHTLPILIESALTYSSWLIRIGLIGCVMASIICLRQTDIKSLIAYSSVAHMGFVFIGLFRLNSTGWWGALVIIVAHGIRSPALFALVGISYYRRGRRRIVLVRSSLTIAPLLTIYWFIFRAANMAAPPTTNLAGEILVISSSINLRGFVTALLGISSFLAGAYNLYLFSSTQHGRITLDMNRFSDASVREHDLMLTHVGCLLFLQPLILGLIC